MSGLRRRTLLAAAPVGAALAASRMASAQSSTIKMGLIAALSGGTAFFQAIRVGAEIAIDRINSEGGLLGGRKLELVIRDEHASAVEAVAGVREFAGAGVNMLFGAPLTSSALAILPIMPTQDAVFTVTGSANLALTHELFNKNSFTIIENDYIIRSLHGRLMAERYPEILQWGAIFPDYATGHASWQFFTKALVEAHAKAGRKAEIAEAVLTKIGQPEFRTQIARLQTMPVEGLFNVLFGPEENSFFQQGNGMGLFKKIKVNAEVSNGPDLGRALRGTLPDNIWSYVHFWAKGNNNPLANDLASEYIKRTNEEYVSPYSYPGHTAILAYANAIKKAGSASTQAVAGAMEGLQYDSAKGASTFRKEDHQGLAKVNFIRLGPNGDSWEAKEFREYAASDMANPATPGVKFTL